MSAYYHLLVVTVLLLFVGLQADDIAEQCAERDGTCTTTNVNNRDIPSSAENVRVAKGSNERGQPPKVSLADCHDRYEECKTFLDQGNFLYNLKIFHTYIYIYIYIYIYTYIQYAVCFR
jgi:hypothetical protein